MAEFDKAFEGNGQQASIFQQQLSAERQAEAMMVPPEPSTAEKLAGALPGLISAGVQLGGAVSKKMEESKLAEQDKKIAKHFLAPQTLLQQKGAAGKNEAATIAGHIKTQLLKEAYASGDLDYANKVMKAHENFLGGNKELMAPTRDEQLAAAQFEGQLAATKKLSEMSASTGISMKNLQAMENRTKRVADKKNELALVDMANKEEVQAAANDIMDLTEQSMEQHVDAAQIALSQIAQQDPAALTTEFPRIRDDMSRGIEREAADLSAQIRANVRDPQQRENMLAAIKERKDASLQQLPALEKILKTNVDMAKNANIMIANRLTPTLAMVSDAYPNMAPDVLRIMQNPGTMEIASKAVPGLKAMTQNGASVIGPAMLAKSLGFDTMDDRLAGYDPRAIDAGVAGMTNAIKADPTSTLEMKQVAQSTMLDKVRGESAEQVAKIMAGNMTDNSRSIVYSNPELQKKMSNSLETWRTQLSTRHGKAAKAGFEQMRKPIKMKLINERGKYSYEITNEQELISGMTDTEQYQLTRKPLPIQAISNYAAQASIYEDLALSAGDDSVEDQIQRLFGAEIIIER